MRKPHRPLLRGQSAIELLILVSFFLVFSIPLVSMIYFSTTQNAYDFSLSQARQACRQVVGSAESVYVQGNGAVEKPVVMFPQGMQWIEASGKEIVIRVVTQSGHSDVVAMGIPEMRVSGEIGTAAGPHRIVVKSFGGYVEISEQ